MQALRLPYFTISPELTQSLRAIATQLEHSSVSVNLLELVYLRISQLNGCSYCIQKHQQSLIALAESMERISVLPDWQSSSLFTPREKTALKWAESLTLVYTTHAADEDYLPLKEYFNDKQITELTFGIVNMNALNRMAIAMRLSN
jgi:AhpD family alkylhydroperoxidase